MYAVYVITRLAGYEGTVAERALVNIVNNSIFTLQCYCESKYCSILLGT